MMALKGRLAFVAPVGMSRFCGEVDGTIGDSVATMDDDSFSSSFADPLNCFLLLGDGEREPRIQELLLAKFDSELGVVLRLGSMLVPLALRWAFGNSVI